MKIALIHDHLNQIGGAEKVLENFTQIYPFAPIYSLIYDKKALGSFLADKKIITSFLQKFPNSLKHLKWYLPLMPTAIENLDLTSYDVILSDSSAFAKGVIGGINTRHICYCHTPTRYLWSDSWKYIDELSHGVVVKKILPYVLNYLRLWDFQATQRVDKFVANSQFVKKRIKKYYKRQSEVIYPPVETDKFFISQNIDKYCVLISRLRPYKRVDLAIQAFNELRLPLIVIGGGRELKYLKKQANSNIKFLGYLNDDKKKARILSQALALIHPQEEDFGITAVEAMAAGRPVIAYKAGGALETVEQGKTGVFFEEQTWESLADTIVKFNHKDFNPQGIKEYAERFGVERFKREIQGIVKKILNPKS